MTSFVNAEHTPRHLGVERVERFFEVVSELARGVLGWSAKADLVGAAGDATGRTGAR